MHDNSGAPISQLEGTLLMAELSFLDAERLLKPFVCQVEDTPYSDAEWQTIRTALHTVVDRSDYQTLGICADTPTSALHALQSYLQAFGDRMDDFDLSLQPTENTPVYLKCNTQRRSLHWDQYTGIYRGVLVTCQSQDLSKSGGTYGHFPLDLFESGIA